MTDHLGSASRRGPQATFYDTIYPVWADGYKMRPGWVRFWDGYETFGNVRSWVREDAGD